MNELENKKFYNSMWFCVLMLILICPVGVVLMWKNGIFNKAVKIIISVIAIPITLLGLLIWISIVSPTTNNNLQKKSDEAVQKRNEEATQSTKEETNKTKEEKKSEVTGEKAPKDSETIKTYVEACKASNEPIISDLLRNPDKYKGKTFLFKGIINQVLEQKEETVIKIYNESTEEEVILIYNRKEGQPRYLEKDYIWALAQFNEVKGMDMLSGDNQAYPIATIKQAYLGEVSDAMINVAEATQSTKQDYKLIYEDNSTYISSIKKKVYLFKAYDTANKAYKEESLVSDGNNTYWYNPNTKELSKSIYQRKYQ